MRNSSVRRVVGAPALVLLRSFSTRTYTRKAKSLSPSPSPSTSCARPPEIPFQPKVANAVNLIGEVKSPIQFETCPDGKAWAATVISREDVTIPVVFEGDLAHTASSHLKLNQFIHIAGQLTSLSHQHTPVQVMAQTLNFVQGYPPPLSLSASGKHVHHVKNEEHDLDQSWKDLLDNPTQWWDVRSTQDNPKGAAAAAFERKADGELLFIDNTTPQWLQLKLESMAIDLKPGPKHAFTGAKKASDSLVSSWTDLLDNPMQWSDYRDKKLNGSVKPKYPDFKRKDGSVSLWLNGAPAWVLPKLKELEFDGPHPLGKSKNKKGGKDEQSWNDLVQNPTKWWDNRSNKINPKSPDFKHKVTGEALWLSGSPSWVLSKLPPLKPKQSV